MKYSSFLNVFILIVFILSSSSLFSKEEIKIDNKVHANAYAGYLENLALSVLIDNKDFANGKDSKIKYDFKNPIYEKLLKEYNIKEIAKQGSSFEKMVRIMDNLAPRLTHDGTIQARIKDIKEFNNKEVEDLNAYELLKYSLDNKKHGINCRMKAEILEEIGLALGIYTRKLWTLPYSQNVDKVTECHVVNEIWDESLNKWIMLDITSNMYWIDSNKTPLSTLELRDKLIKEEKGLDVVYGSNIIKIIDSKFKTKKERESAVASELYYHKIYYLKNLYILQYQVESGVKESESYYLVPNNSSFKNKVSKYLITRSSVESSPIGK